MAAIWCSPITARAPWAACPAPGCLAIMPSGASAMSSMACVMGMNWSRIASRDRMRRQGVEDIDGKMPLFVQPPKQPRRKLSKAELRQKAAAALGLARGSDIQKQVSVDFERAISTPHHLGAANSACTRDAV